MSEEFKIPLDLAIFESKLRALPVANSGIDRDVMLYQAGWSAALASQNSLSTDRKRGWGWPAATGLFATLAASLALILLGQTFRADNDSVGPNQVVQVDMQRPELENESDQETIKEFEELLENKLAKRNNVTAWNTSHKGVWNSRQTLNARSRFDELDWQTVPVYETSGESGSRAKTTTELLRELMPKTKSRLNNRRPVWDWWSQTWGEVI